MKNILGRVPLLYPLPLSIVGVKTEEKILYTTVNNHVVISMSPPLVGVFVEDGRDIGEHIGEGVRLSINFPSTLLLNKADLCANVAGETFDKSSLFETKYALGAPYIDECPVVLIAEVADVVDIRKQHLYLCEIKRTLVDDGLFIEQNIPTMTMLDPIIYGLDEKYYQLGNVIGKAAIEGRQLYKDIRKTMPPVPYTFHFKHKLCRLKDAGATYKDLAETYGVYHETIEDWYTLYTLFGRLGLTKKMAEKLSKTKFSKAEKKDLAQRIIRGEKTYRALCKERMVSLSRLRNWVKKERR